jgi:hypothetical protein
VQNKPFSLETLLQMRCLCSFCDILLLAQLLHFLLLLAQFLITTKNWSCTALVKKGTRNEVMEAANIPFRHKDLCFPEEEQGRVTGFSRVLNKISLGHRVCEGHNNLSKRYLAASVV